jgi:hypothetical protein
MKKLYYVSSFHSVYEDSFTEGESKFVNEFADNKVISAESALDAVKEYYNKVIYKPFRMDSVEIDECKIYDSFMVDEDGALASEFDEEMWKKEERVLFSENIDIEVYEMNQVFFN